MDCFIGVHQFVPFTLPHFDHCVTCSEQRHAFGERGLIEFLDGSIRRGIMGGVSHGITTGTATVETPVELVDGASQGIVAIDKIAVGDGSDRLFAPVTNVPNAVGTSPLLGNEVFLVIEPLQGSQRLVDLGPSPATQRFDSNGVGGEMVLAPIQIAGTRDGDAFGHGIEASLPFEFLLKGFTPCFQESHIRLAIVNHFLLEIELNITTDLVRVSMGQFVFLFGHHAIGIVKFQIGDAAHVLLMIQGIEQVRKESLF